MTTGQIIFYSGIALLGLTAVLAIIFAIKKPKYQPDRVVYAAAGGGTQKLRNGYPTDPLTIRREPAVKTDTDRPETEHLPGKQTEKMIDTGASQETEAVHDAQLTEKLPQERTRSGEPTELL